MDNYFLFQCGGIIQAVSYLELSTLHCELAEDDGFFYSDFMVVF